MTCEANCDCEICCNNPPKEIETAGTIKIATPEFFKDIGKGNALDGSFQARTAAPIIPIVSPAIYGEDNIKAVIDAINNVIDSADQTLGFSPTQTNRVSIRENMPALSDRINAGPFTSVEVANFINDAGYQSTDQVIADVKKKPNIILNLMNAFFALNLTALALNAICSVLQNPFGAVAPFLDTLEDIEKTLRNLPKDIEDFAKKVEDAVKDLFENLKEKVNNIAKGFEDTIKGVIDLSNRAAQAISAKFTAMVSDVKAFLGDINRDGIIKTMKKAIASAADSIAELPETAKDMIEFLLFTFCKISKPLEDMINEPVDALKKFADKFSGTSDDLKKESAQASELAVEAGRVAGVPETVMQACEEFRTSQNSGVAERWQNPDLDAFGGTGPFIFSPQHTSHPEPTEWSNLTFTDKVINNSFWTTEQSIPMRDYYQTASWDGNYNAKVPDPRCPKDIGYYGCKLEVLEKANQVGEQLGLTFHITSAYRHPIYNQDLRNRGKGAALHSQHVKGNALDILYTGSGVNTSNRSRVIKAFRAAGFGGIGIYSGFLHVDVGPVRSW